MSPLAATATLAFVSSLLRDRFGWDPDVLGGAPLANAVRRRAAAAGIAEELYAVGLPGDAGELQSLAEELAVPETWFFRDPAVYDLLGERARAWRNEPRPRLRRLLSVPCASGEEPYSIAMTLIEAGIEAGAAAIEADDVSRRLLDAAETGEYGPRSFRGPGGKEGWRERFFTPAAGDLRRIAGAVRERVRFGWHNLSGDPLPGGCDVVFCRNLLIYLDEAARRRVVGHLEKMVKPGGLLFVGHAERLALFERGFRPHGAAGAFAYVRAGEPEERETTTRKAEPVPEAVPPPAPGVAAVRQLADRGDYAAAATRCDALIEADPGNAEACLLRAVIEEARPGGSGSAAEPWYRRAIYLDPALHDALLGLALLLERGEAGPGRSQEAERLRRRARAFETPSAPEGAS